MARAKLTEQQKIYVVTRLAAYDTPAAIARDLAENFGVTVSHQTVRDYEPGRVPSRRLAPRWRELFARERAAYLARTAAIGVDKAEPAAPGAGKTKPAPCRDGSARGPSSAQNRLTDQQRIYVVRRLAAYDKPGEIAQALKREFGVTISIKAIEGYNPFAQAREAYLASTAEIGVTHMAVRIRLRERYVHRAEEAGQFKAASDILDAIARDVGDIPHTRHTRDRFSGRGTVAPARIILNGRPVREPAPAPAPEADGGVRKPRE